MMPGKQPQDESMTDDAGPQQLVQPAASPPVNAPPATAADAVPVPVTHDAPAASGSRIGATAAAAGSGSGAGGYTLKRSPTQIQITNNLQTKSSSVLINGSGQAGPITPKDRQYLDGILSDATDWPWRDGFKIAVFSQEASRHFSIKYWESGVGRYEPHMGGARCSMDQVAQATLISKIGTYTNVSTYDEALVKLFENRETPHVVAVVEGRRNNLPDEFTLKGTRDPANSSEVTTVATYKLYTSSLQGKNRLNHDDSKQNMHFYIRDDMQIAPTEATIAENFKVGEIHFATGKGKYSVLVPHIPNDIARYPAKAVELLKAYAQRVASERTVVGYIGDTNFNKPIQEYSSPSAGGYQESGAYLVPASSGAKKFSYFMQAHTFFDGSNSYRMQRPTLLNHV